MAIIAKSKFEEQIINLLDGMGKIDISKGEKVSYLIKNDIIFAKVIDDKVFLRKNEDKEYDVIPENVLLNKDLFLMQATKSYFIAKKQHEEQFAA